MLERVMMRTPDEQTDIQIAFKETLDLNESLISATEDKDWDQVNEILDIDGFSLLSSQFTKAFPAIATSGEADLLIKLSQRPDFKLNLHTLPITYNLFEREIPCIEHLLVQSIDSSLNRGRTEVLKRISQDPCYNTIVETLFKRQPHKLLRFDPDHLKALTIPTCYINATFAHGNVPVYKPVLNNARNYETPLTKAIKDEKWDHVRYFISIKPPAINGKYIHLNRAPQFVDFHKKASTGGSAYSLLKKAAKKSAYAEYLLDQMQDRIAEQKAYKAENAQKKSLLHKMRLK